MRGSIRVDETCRAGGTKQVTATVLYCLGIVIVIVVAGAANCRKLTVANNCWAEARMEKKNGMGWAPQQTETTKESTTDCYLQQVLGGF